MEYKKYKVHDNGFSIIMHVSSFSSTFFNIAFFQTKSAAGFHTKVEVECSNYNEAIQAAQAGADIIMLDNFTPESAAQTAKEVKAQFPSILLEVSWTFG